MPLNNVPIGKGQTPEKVIDTSKTLLVATCVNAPVNATGGGTLDSEAHALAAPAGRWRKDQTKNRAPAHSIVHDTCQRMVLPVSLRRQSRNPNPGVAFVADVQSDEQRRDLLDDAGVF